MELQYYFAGDFGEFENYFSNIEHQKRKYKKSDSINAIGEPMDELFYILNGTMAVSYLHKSGHIKAFSFYGKGYLAPLYFPKDIETMHATAFTAVSDLEVYAFKRLSFKQHLDENPKLNDAMYWGYINLVSLLIQDNANQLFCSGMEKICNFFYIYLENMKEKDNTIYLTQNEIMEFVGMNLANVSKYLKILRDEGAIRTQRNKIIVENLQKLKIHCTF
ncbi:Crp/Fnr family transcriptional regulator [Acetobacterium wieringae]|uniref:Crp/Fnr family transcriptional regulator n=1 Tax=Acetobacterium wieringae TaxID=52694 RepID=UPI0026F1A746|nr:Crp/Fnr family transcriptional regulator [Acetobacterium wieringae]